MKKYVAAVIALLVSGLVATLVLAVFFPLSEEGSAFGRTVASLFVYLPFVIAFSMGLGMPLFYFFERFWRIDLKISLLAGSIAGAAASVVIRLPNIPPGDELISDAVVGALSGLIFWLVWNRLNGKRVPKT
jgi:hypothetical protein